MVVAVRDHDIIAVAGLTDRGEQISEIKPFLFKEGTYSPEIFSGLIKALEKHAKIETIQHLLINILRKDEERWQLVEELGYQTDPDNKQGRTKYIEFRKEINYFRQHDLAL